MEHLVQIAKNIAQIGYEKRNSYLAAIGIRADGKIVVKKNQICHFPNVTSHAEARLLTVLGREAELVIVIRIKTGTGELGMAKPCPACRRALKKARVKKIMYSDLDGKIVNLGKDCTSNRNPNKFRPKTGQIKGWSQ